MQQPTRSELEILEILWTKKEARAQDVHDQLNKSKDVGYTGTLKLMQLMHQKGLLERRREGRSHVYFPLISEAETKNTLLDKFVDATFGGSASRMMMQLLGNKKVSQREMDEIREYLDRIQEQKK